MPRKSESRSKSILKMVFKEIVNQISEEQAEVLEKAYLSGDSNIVFVAGENSKGKYNQTAFSCFTVPHSEWKLYYPDDPNFKVVQVQVPQVPEGLEN